jgi:hypothetical protein
MRPRPSSGRPLPNWRRHKLGVLDYLLAMVQLEAEERLRLRSKRKLS